MKKGYLHQPGRMVFAAAFIVLLVGGWLAIQPAMAGELDKLDTSLKLIPANASFYSSMLRNREQIEILLNSNAWEKIKSISLIQQNLALLNSQFDQPGSPAAQLRAAMENPEVKKLINLACDMGSNEIFFYGGENFNEFVELMQHVISAMRFGPTMLMVSGEAQSLDPNQLQAKVLLETLIEHRDIVAFPDMLLGFRLNNPSAASEALIKLETIINLTMEAQPMLKGHFQKENIDNHEYLVLRLDGKMIPWEEVPLEDLKQLVDDESDWQKLVDHVKEMNLVIAMGLYDNYLLVSIGSSVDGIKNLNSDQRLMDLPEFAPLEKFVDKRLTDVCYLSRELNEQLNNNEKQIDDLRDFVVQMLPLADLTDEQKERIKEDIEEFADDLKSLMPEKGAIMGLSFMTDKGIESYSYNWSEHSRLDGSQPLGLLAHAGANPLLGLVSRQKVSIEEYDEVVKWANVGWKYAEELLLPKLPDEQREKADAFLKDAIPLLERLDKVYRDMWLPAMADGQVALVIDAKLKSKQLQAALPAMEKEMPIIEPALVLGVSDAELLRKAVAELYVIFNDFIALINKNQPNVIPFEFKLPEPKVVESADGSIYSYPFPEEWGVDKNIVLNAGLSKNVAVLAISTDHTKRLLKETPLGVGGLLTKTDQPLAVAGWFEWSDLLGVVTPWVEYGLEQIDEEQFGGQKDYKIGQIKKVLEILHVVRGYTSESSLEDDCLVTHSLWEIHDLSN